MALDQKKEPKFEIDASVVYQLGEQLISDEIQALLELIKNSYDADSSYVNVTVETRKSVGDNSLNFPNSKGYIVIEDDGIGMDWDDIERGWFTISASPKREMKTQGKTTEKGRTPLGDKGLGRLGSQRLGRNIEMWTSRKGSKVEYYVGIDWKNFKGRTLSKVPFYYKAVPREKPRKGTNIVISDLRLPEKWEGQAQDKLIRKTSELIFPFEEVRPFEVYISINGKRVDLDEISESVLDVANMQFSFSFDGEILYIGGKYRLTALLAPAPDSQQKFQRLLEPDQGVDYYAYLTSKDCSWSIPGLKWEDELGWFVSFKQDYPLEDLPGVEQANSSSLITSFSDRNQKPRIANPGPFRGKIFSFALRGTDLSAISDVFNVQSDFNRFVKRHVGIRVFRDGFGIRPFGLGGNDWLDLGSGWTSAKSYYGLRPNNVIGYVVLTAKENSRLEEATDREGFIENTYSRNFYLLMQRVVKTINDASTNLRRGYLDYVKLKAEQEIGITSQNTSKIFSRIRDTSNASRNLEARVTKTRDTFEAVSARVQTLTEDIETTPLFHTEQERKATPLLQEINKTLDEATSILRQIESMLSEARQLGEIADILEADLEHLREELELFSELAGLGITAEALSHEIKIIADGLAARTKDLLTKLKTRQSIDPQIIAYTEHIHTVVGRIRKQLSHLDPSLRYVRERRDKIKMYAFIKGIKEFYTDRFVRNNIEFEIEKPYKDFTILMNKGKLTQVVDNLLLNSEYWLREDLRKKYITTAKVVMRVKVPMLEIWDTGRGVAPSVEHYLFQPFVTTKPKGVGRGLGLFIARQLLDSSGCLISLLPERNEFDRRYIFRIDFTGAINE